MGEKFVRKFCLNSDFHINLGIFYMPQIYDMGLTALLPLRRKACCGFFRPKSSTASSGFEPANLGTKSQHATSRPPKPIKRIYNIIYILIYNFFSNANTCHFVEFVVLAPGHGSSVTDF